MHKTLWNIISLDLLIKAKSPILIKSGINSPDPSLPDMQFVRTVIERGEILYIPGSSIKGVFRSFTERVLRTINKDWACNIFSNEACGKKLSDERDSATIYRSSCYVCKLYGNTKLKGRVSFTDFLQEGNVKTEVRYGVAICRLTNAVAQGPFDMEIVTSGSFRGSIRLENFEAWQLGLLALTIDAIEKGVVKMGFGKNRGFGEVGIDINTITLDNINLNIFIPKNEIWGVGTFLKSTKNETLNEDLLNYGFKKDDRITDLPEAEEEIQGLYIRRTYSKEAWKGLAERAMSCLSMIGG